MRNSDKFRALLGSSILEQINQEDKCAFLDAATVRIYDSPKVVLSQGEISPGVFQIAHGNVAVTAIGRSGDQANLARLSIGDIFGDIEAISEQPCLATCMSEAGCQVLFWPREVFLKQLSNTQFITNFARLFYQRLSIINQVRATEQYSPVDRKIVACLLRMSVRDPVIRQSQANVAEAIGCSRQTVNRVLGEMRDEGILELKKGQIVVVDRSELERRMAE